MTAAQAGALLSLAVGFALSPAGIIELILVLFSRRRVLNSIVFVVSTWVLMTVAVAAGALGSQATGTETGGVGAFGRWVLGIFAVLLLALAAVNWAKRADATEPAVFRTIGNMGPVPVALLALGLTIVNPKNLPLLLGGGEIVASASLPVLAGVLFVIVGSAPFWLAMSFSLIGGRGADAVLERCRVWLTRRNRIVMALACLVMGAVLLVKAVWG